MLTGCAQWAVTLGRFDVMYATQTKVRFSAAPKQEHLMGMLRLFGYLKTHSKNGIMVDTRERIIPVTEEIQVNWQEQYPGQKKNCHQKCQSPKGLKVNLNGICGC